MLMSIESDQADYQVILYVGVLLASPSVLERKGAQHE